MVYVDIPGADGAMKLSFYLAAEEYVATLPSDREYFFTWQVPPTVIIGRNQLLEREVDLKFCRKNGIDVFRRKSGGGCVYSDMGCIMFSYISPGTDAPGAFVKYMGKTAEFLREAGMEASLSGRNDVLIGGRKVSGAAVYRLSGHIVMHNTLLVDTDLDLLEKAINPSGAKLHGKGVSSVRERVANICEFTPMSVPELRALARKMFCGDETLTLEDRDIERIREIEASLSSDEFVYGRNPSYTFERTLYIPGTGTLECFAQIKGGKIRDINIMGDYFLLGDLDNELTGRLKGTEFKRESVRKTLEGIDTGSIIRGLKPEGLLELLFG